jgi:hypothetical protein
MGPSKAPGGGGGGRGSPNGNLGEDFCLESSSISISASWRLFFRAVISLLAVLSSCSLLCSCVNASCALCWFVTTCSVRFFSMSAICFLSSFISSLSLSLSWSFSKTFSLADASLPSNSRRAYSSTPSFRCSECSFCSKYSVNVLSFACVTCSWSTV